MDVQRPLVYVLIGMIVGKVEVIGASYLNFNFTVDVEVGDQGVRMAAFGYFISTL